MCLVICANCKLTQGSSLFRISRAAASTERLTCSIGYPLACVIVHEPQRYEYSSSGRVTSNREYGQSGDTRPKGSRRSEIQREQKNQPPPKLHHMPYTYLSVDAGVGGSLATVNQLAAVATRGNWGDVTITSNFV